VLEYLGYQFTSEQDSLKNNLETAGICFMHAPLFHPAMKNVGPTRRELQSKTFFNILGPMVNPSSPNSQIIGVYSLEIARLYAYLYQRLKTKFTIIHSLDGYDEISLTGLFKVISNEKDETLSPENLGFPSVSAHSIMTGGSIEEAAKIMISVLEGKGTVEQQNVVLANSAMAIQCINQNRSFDDAVQEAKESISSGNALGSLKRLIQ
jgi:anthranilate phosphoribosyltransferase